MLKIQSQKLDLDADLYDGEKGELILPFLNFLLFFSNQFLLLNLKDSKARINPMKLLMEAF